MTVQRRKLAKSPTPPPPLLLAAHLLSRKSVVLLLFPAWHHQFLEIEQEATATKEQQLPIPRRNWVDFSRVECPS